MQRGGRLQQTLLAALERPLVSLAAIVGSYLAAMGFVVWDEGTPSAYAHFMYAPTIIAAYRYHARGGAACGFLGGVGVGPGAAWLVTGLPVTESNWLVRAVWIAIVGYALGALFDSARRQSRRLDESLHVDRATGRPNLAGLRRSIHHLIQQPGAGDELVVTAIHVANHGEVAATFGYAGADGAIQALSDLVAPELPAQAVLGRTGPDELMIVESLHADGDSNLTTRRLRALMHPALHVGSMSIYVDVVFGSVRAPLSRARVDDLFLKASAAAHRAHDKGQREGQYHAEDERARREAVRLLGDVPRALREGEMHLVYQPKLSLRRNDYSGLEALIRWNHPEHGPIPPDRFIPLVEDTALIEELTRWVLDAAIGQASQWQAQAPLTMAVNVSARNLMNDDLLREIDCLLQRHGLPPDRLELEITETAIPDIEASHLHLLEDLRRQGVRIAIDDFGTGYASLAYIRKLPVDILKLDRSFTRAAPAETRDRQMLRRIVQIARDLDLEVVGEGVEDHSTLTLLRNLGCDDIQGYYVSRPLAADQVRPLLDQGWAGRGGGSA